MPRPSPHIPVYLEIASRRTFAGALDWPGWCRSGRDESSALQALLDYGARYQRALRTARLGFHAPSDLSAFAVVERLKGNATTDFGAPDLAPGADALPIDDAELRRLTRLLKACWQAFDDAVLAASGKTLRTGPRGGGRNLDGIIRHVRDGDGAYLARVGGKQPPGDVADLSQRLDQTRQAILGALAMSARGELPAHGPRGGVRWRPRSFIRRVAWHVLDHTWEVEDRSSNALDAPWRP